MSADPEPPASPRREVGGSAISRDGAGQMDTIDLTTRRNGRPTLGDAVALEPGKVLSALGSGRDGLTAELAEARLRSDGRNVLPEAEGPSPARQLLGQFVHFFAGMLWTAALLAFIGGLPALGWAIVAVVLINGVFSFAQELRAEHATKALRELLPMRCAVVRGGRATEVPAESLVAGDLLLLREGDRISSDARVVEAHGLRVDNSMLTGESDPAGRTSRTLQGSADVSAADNVVFAGTYVVSGAGVAVVLATAERTRLGSISKLTATLTRRASPLRVELERMVHVLALCALGVGLLSFLLTVSVGMHLRDGFVFAVGVIVALVPEGLLPTFTLSLALGAKRMAKRHALVRHLEAVETLGSTTIICSDKTGTITTNQMTVRSLVVAGGTYSVSGSGYDPRGTILSGRLPLSDVERLSIAPFLHAAALCGDARLEEHEDTWRCVGDPSEGALLVLAAKGGTERESEERRAPRIREFAFESARKRMSTVHQLASGEVEILTKGAPETILPLCTSVIRNGRHEPLDAVEEAWIHASVDRYAAKGYRVLACARRWIEGPAPTAPEDAERDMGFLGLAAMSDPVRPEVPEAIKRCRDAGIKVLMITGDHPATAAAVAREAGIRHHTVMVASELPDSDEALGVLLSEHLPVLARIAPEQKLRIARALQARGEVVAMTGDGVNDAPALRQADIGIAMGKSGTDVAREAADLVLLDDNFAHIVEAVEEGRAAFQNMRKFLTYVLTSNVPELAPFLVWALSRGSVPLTLSVLQILAVDLGTDLLPALALGAERPDTALMTQPPRAKGARLLDLRLLARAYGFLGPVEAAASLAMLPLGAAMFFGWSLGETLPHAGPALATLSTMVWTAIVVSQVANVFACRDDTASVIRRSVVSNPILVIAVAVELLVVLASVYLPALRDALGTMPLSPVQWLPVTLAAPALLLAEEGRKALARRRLRPRLATAG